MKTTSDYPDIVYSIYLSIDNSSANGRIVYCTKRRLLETIAINCERQECMMIHREVRVGQTNAFELGRGGLLNPAPPN